MSRGGSLNTDGDATEPSTSSRTSVTSQGGSLSRLRMSRTRLDMRAFRPLSGTPFLGFDSCLPDPSDFKPT